MIIPSNDLKLACHHSTGVGHWDRVEEVSAEGLEVVPVGDVAGGGRQHVVQGQGWEKEAGVRTHSLK